MHDLGAVSAELFGRIWSVFADASIYVLAGLFLAGLIQIFLNEAVIAKHLGKADFKSVLRAALLGVPLPLCSCGVLPAAFSLQKKGAAKGATLSFMIATPESGVDSFLLSLALLDPVLAVFRPLAAFVTAMVAGSAENLWGSKAPLAEAAPAACACGGSCQDEKMPAPDTPFVKRFGGAMNYAFVEMLSDIGKWLMLGMALAGIIAFALPESFLLERVSSEWGQMLMMLAIGVPMYICATASTPIAAALIMKGLSPGAALVFLLAGPATNAAGIALIWRAMGRRTVMIYLASISATALLLGWLLNAIYGLRGINPAASLGKAAELVPPWLGNLSAIALIILTINAILKASTYSAAKRRYPPL